MYSSRDEREHGNVQGYTDIRVDFEISGFHERFLKCCARFQGTFEPLGARLNSNCALTLRMRPQVCNGTVVVPYFGPSIAHPLIVYNLIVRLPTGHSN